MQFYPILIHEPDEYTAPTLTKGGTMTLKEALESGKRFKRQGSPSWIAQEMIQYWEAEDIMATDYELEPEMVKKTVYIALYKGADNKIFNTSSAYASKEELEQIVDLEKAYTIVETEIEVEE